MSQENVEVVRAVIEAQQRRDWQAFRKLYIDQLIPSVWTVWHGRVVRVRGYRDEAEALEAAGLRE